jgi:hypothetical protein
MSSSISISDPRRLGQRKSVVLKAAAFLGSVLLTWVIYVTGSAVLLRNSVVLRSTKEMIEAKLAPLQVPGRPPYLTIISGSNGLYSIDSPTLSKAIHMPVINAAMQWSYTYYMLDQVTRLVKANDVLLLPLEFEYFTGIEDQPKLESCYLIMQDRTEIRGAADFLTLLSRCSPYLILDALIAELLSRAGMSYPGQPIGSVLSPEGDILENTAGTNRWRQPTTSTQSASKNKFNQPRLEALLQLAHRKGAKVFLSYPVRPERDGNFPAVSTEWINGYETWAKSVFATVISSPESHMFPVSCFFDSPYHLHRGCTALNSEIYGAALLDALESTRK